MKPAGVQSSGLLNQPCGVETHVGLDGSNTSILLTLQCDTLKKQVVIMSFQAMAWAVSQQIPTHEKFTLIMLANYADASGKCWPSIETLCRDTSLSRPSIKRALRNLVELELIAKVKRRQGNLQSSNFYLLSLSKSSQGLLDPLSRSNRPPNLST
jgi:hypothetical protein